MPALCTAPGRFSWGHSISPPRGAWAEGWRSCPLRAPLALHCLREAGPAESQDSERPCDLPPVTQLRVNYRTGPWPTCLLLPPRRVCTHGGSESGQVKATATYWGVLDGGCSRRSGLRKAGQKVKDKNDDNNRKGIPPCFFPEPSLFTY